MSGRSLVIAQHRRPVQNGRGRHGQTSSRPGRRGVVAVLTAKMLTLGLAVGAARHSPVQTCPSPMRPYPIGRSLPIRHTPSHRTHSIPSAPSHPIPSHPSIIRPALPARPLPAYDRTRSVEGAARHFPPASHLPWRARSARFVLRADDGLVFPRIREGVCWLCLSSTCICEDILGVRDP